MDVQSIRLEARKLYQQNKKTLVYSFYMITCLTMCFQILNSGWLILLAQIFLVTIPHGYVYISLKLIQNKNLNGLTLHDVFIGLFSLLKYLPSYLTRILMIYLSSFALLMPALLISTPGEQLSSYELMSDVVSFIVQRGMNFNFAYQLFQNMKPSCYLFIVASVIVYVLLTVSFIFVPYIVEDYDYSWLEALGKSILLIKGHAKECLQLLMSFLPNIVIYNLLASILTILFSMLGTYTYIILIIILMVLQIRLYLSEYHLSIAMFYLEIRDEKKDENELFKIK